VLYRTRALHKMRGERVLARAFDKIGRVDVPRGTKPALLGPVAEAAAQRITGVPLAAVAAVAHGCILCLRQRERD
jgi:hypothetical protein